jgi:hypothetical protein
MAWFTAVLVRGAHVDGALDDERLGDMLYRLIEAPDAESAYAQAYQLGAAAQDDYTDEDGAAVTLRFLGLADLIELPGPPGAGAEVYSQLIPRQPSEMLVEKEELTVFEPAGDEEELDDEGPLKPR